MNRERKEEKRKYDEARKGLSGKQITELNRLDDINKKIDDLAKSMHVERFGEEYDFIYDGIHEASKRNQGVNPMSDEYIEKIRLKRDELGVSQLDKNGMAISKETYELCRKEARETICSDLNLDVTQFDT